MIILKRLLKKKINIFFISILFFKTCTYENKNEEFIARVNDSYLRREDISSLIDTSVTNISEIEAIIYRWIEDELLFQVAVEEGITEKKIFDDILLKSTKQLAISLFLQEKLESFDINPTTKELLNFYENNQVMFQNSNPTYQLNIAIFKDEDFAIKFRELAIESNWNKAIQFTKNNNNLISISSNFIAEDREIYPIEIARLAKSMLNNEISIVLKDLEGKYYVFQLIKIFNPFEIYPFDLVKDLVREKYISTQKVKMFEEYMAELYSKNKIEIKQWNYE